MREALFLLLILFPMLTSFLWENSPDNSVNPKKEDSLQIHDKEKHLRQLRQNGESALKKEEYGLAKKAFEELLGCICPTSSTVGLSSKHRVNWITYIDVAMRLALSWEGLNEKEEAEKVLTLLLIKGPPEELISSARLMRARLATTKDSFGDAYIEMQALASQLPMEHWSAKERSFFYALGDSLDTYYDDLIGKAKRYLTAQFYPEALSLFQEILTAIERGIYPKAKGSDSIILKGVRFRLAECYFLSADYERSLSLCTQELSPETLGKIDPEMIYLSALCHREKKEFEKALELFQNYTQSGDKDALEHYNHALFEVGNYYYQKGQISKARRYFENLQSTQGKPGAVAAVLLARIYIDEGEPKEVEKLLFGIAEVLSPQDPLRYECYYLRGLAAYQLEAYGEAQNFFIHSLPEKKWGKWSPQVYYHLGWCYIHLGDDPLKAESVRLAYFKQAEETFKKLISPLDAHYKESAFLALAQLFLLRFQYSGDPTFLAQVKDLLHPQIDAFSLEGQIEALLLCAHAMQNYEGRETFLNQATLQKYQNTTLYAQSWYQRGLNHFQEGLRNPQHSILFEAAIGAFENAFCRLDMREEKFAMEILKLEAKAHICRNSPLASLGLLEKLLSQFDESLEERRETLYLRGLLASHLNDPCYFSVAEESFHRLINTYPNGKHTEDALYALATLYYGRKDYLKAKEIFLKLTEEYPKSIHAPQAWFWTAETALLLGESPTPYRSRVYEDYPKSLQAADAYFRQYSYADYLEGKESALAHLEGFDTLFPSSPMGIVTHYLIGHSERDLGEGERAFEKALSSFNTYRVITSEPKKIFFHFRYLTMIELASRLMETPRAEEDLERSEMLLTTLVEEFSQKDHPLTSVLKDKNPYPPLFEEGEFKLAHCYLKQGKNSHAQKILMQMLKHHSERGTQTGYYLSQVWQELGKLALHCKEYSTALNCFEIGEECGTAFLSDEQKLTMWLLQSDAYRGKKDYHRAMRLLSKVINAEIVSPLRVKALFLRAEIYELAGRRELAIRQLEATAKKGGEWAQKAKERLKIKYGLQ